LRQASFTFSAMTASGEKRLSRSDVLRRRADRRAMVLPIAGFFAASISAFAFAANGGKSTWTIILWLSPVAFLLWLVVAVVKSLRRADEYQQRVQLEAMAVGFAATMITAAVFLMIESAPIKVSGILGFGPGGLVWFAGTAGWCCTLWFRSRATR
jgi:hypothetical protein